MPVSGGGEEEQGEEAGRVKRVRMISESMARLDSGGKYRTRMKIRKTDKGSGK